MPRTKGASRPAAPARPRAALRGNIAATTVAPCDSGALPHDVLLLIFDHLNGWQLTRCVSVCKAWRALLCGTEECWRKALAADFVDGERAHDLAANWSLFQPQHVWRYRRVPSAMRRGAYKFALLGLQAMRREQDAHVQRTLQADAARALNELVEFESMQAAVAAAVVRSLRTPFDEDSAFGVADSSEFVDAIMQAAVLDRQVALRDPRCWGMVAPRERVTWRHRLRGSANELGRAGLAPANASLRSWWLTTTQPYRILWMHDKPALVKHKPRRIFLPLSLQADGARAAYKLYQTLAATLLRGRCRCCNRVTDNVHAQLRVPMCATLQCAGAYPVQSHVFHEGEVEAAAQPRRRRPAWRPRNAGKRKAKQA